MRAKKIVAVGLAAAVILGGCGNADVDEASSKVIVSSVVAEKGDLTLTTDFVGNISADESVSIIPKVAGTVTDTYAEVGDMVSAGDTLFKIDDEAAQLQYRQAELTLQQAQQSAETTQNTTAITMYSNIYNAQAGVDTAKEGLKTVKNNLDDAEDAVDDLEKQKSKMKKLKSSYEGYLSDYNNAVASGDTAAAAAAQAALDGLASSLGVDTSTDGYEAIGTAISSTISTLNSGIDQAESTVDTLKSTKKTTQISLDQAEQALETIYETQAASGGDVLAATLATGLSLAQVGVDSAKLALSYYSVTTPISGKIVEKNVSVNDMASSAVVSYVVAQDNTMTVTFNVSEDVHNTLSVGDKVTVERNGNEFTGTITEVGNSVNSATGLFQIKAAVLATGSELPDGVSVKITCNTYKAENTIVIPYDAVYYENDGSYVYVNDNGIAKKTYVTCGIFNDEEIAITDGLNPGDEIVTSWASRLADGAELEIKNEDADSADTAAKTTESSETEDSEENTEDTEASATEKTEEVI